MPNNVRFPFKLQAAFFITVNCRRSSTVPEPLTTNFKTLVKSEESNFPNLQIFLKLETEGEQPVTFEIELVGIFAHIEDQPVPDRSIIREFISEQAIYMLWPYMVQMVAQITAQMGTNPVRLPTPHYYDLRPEPPPAEETK